MTTQPPSGDPTGDTVKAAPSTLPGGVFVDPSGRRWKRLRIVAAVLLALATVGAVVAAPHVAERPALMGRTPAPDLAVDLRKTPPPVVGEGPLVRVLEVRREGATSVGYDPFTQERIGQLSAEEKVDAGASTYVIQRFGYSATASKTIALTFDDGPDPVYTRKLLDVLAREKVPATFFITGTNVARHSDLIAREVREGHAVANHSLTHVDVSDATALRTRAELVATDRVLRAVTGKEVGWFRLPYEGDDAESTQATIEGLLRSQQLGYLVTSHDYDTNDWDFAARPVKGPIPLPDLSTVGGLGGNITMLLHDGGGTGRQQTVDFVEKFIPYARAQGYTFHTMPQVQPWLAERTLDVTPTFWDRAALFLVRAFYAWPDYLVKGLFGFAVLAVVVVGLGNSSLALLRHRRRRRIAYPTAGEMSLPVSVLLAAYNERGVIARTLRSVLDSDYPVLEVVVVDDGSTDGTADVVRQVAAADPRVRLVVQSNAGKAHALNNGLSQIQGDYVVTLDADTILARHTITNLVRHFALDAEGTMGAVAGVVRVGNRTRNLLTRWQALEYLTQIGVERAAHDALGAISIVPGACAAWRKEAIVGVGGYSSTTFAEDCDLSLSLHQAGWRITQDDEAPAYTEAPEDVDSLLAQRIRWTYGTLQAIYKHRTLLFNRRHGWLGWFVLPNYVLSIVVPVVFLPFVVVMGAVLVQQQGPAVLALYFLIFMTVHMIIASVGLRLMHERPHHLLVVPIYRIVFEPLRAYLLYTSILMAIKGVRTGWNKLQRTGSLDDVVDVRDVVDVPNVPAQHGTRPPAATDPPADGPSLVGSGRSSR